MSRTSINNSTDGLRVLPVNTKPNIGLTHQNNGRPEGVFEEFQQEALTVS
jgi:hypothetical protein